MSKIKIVELGKISLTEQVVVSDPYYNRDAWCIKDNIPVQPGEYHTYAVTKEDNSLVVACLICVNCQEFTSLKTALTKKWYAIDAIGADTGKAGIFDNLIYPCQKNDVDNLENDEFYIECSEIANNDQPYGRLKSRRGIISSSGYGGGFYHLKVIHKNECCIALMIDFKLATKDDIKEAILQGSVSQK